MELRRETTALAAQGPQTWRLGEGAKSGWAAGVWHLCPPFPPREWFYTLPSQVKIVARDTKHWAVLISELEVQQILSGLG